MAYNVQIAVDSQYHFIVATDISSKGSDLDQLYPMSTQAKEAVENDDLIVVADKQKAQRDKGKFTRDTIVEHPFGTIKQGLGWSHFLVRGKEKVSGENALIMFTYDLRRLLGLIGIALFQRLLIARKEGDLEAIREEIARHIALLWLFLAYSTKNIKIGKTYWSDHRKIRSES